MNGVDHQRAVDVAEAFQGAAERLEIPTLFRSHGSADVFEHQMLWGASDGFQSVDDRPKAPERARALAVQPLAGAREREVLAGGGGPGEIGLSRQVRSLEVVDVAEPELAIAPVGDIGFAFLRVDVVGEEAPPLRPQARAR